MFVLGTKVQLGARRNLGADPLPSREYSALGGARRFGNIAINYIYIMYITIYMYITTIYESQ